MQNLLEPLIVSWAYESETPGSSAFIDRHEWWGTRDMAAFLSVPAAIEFQEKHNWEKVRLECHELVRAAQARICALAGLPPIHSQSDGWFHQMAAAPLPPGLDLAVLKTRMLDEYRIEIPLTAWKDKKLIRVSIQGYNTQKDVDILLGALSDLLLH